MAAAQEADDSAKRDRSPAYPFISLGTAMDRVAAFDTYFKRYPAPLMKVGLAWGMKEKSSQAAQTIAALKYFGLVEYQGSGDAKSAALTEDARTYLRAQQQTVKNEVLKRLALNPKIIRKYWEMWSDDRPQDPICLDELVLKGGFTEAAAGVFLKVYDDTITYAGLKANDKIAKPDGTDNNQEDGGNPDIAVGDFVQWESNGVLQFPQPKRVRALQDYEGTSWLFVDDSEAGIPMSEVTLEQKGTANAAEQRGQPPRLPIQQQAPAVHLQDSEREWIRGPLSKDASYRIIVSGDLGPREIAKLIKLLEAQKLVLSDDDEETAN